MCKWHCQYEVENNECEYLTDCEWLISEVMVMLRGWVELRSLMAGGETPPKSLSFCHQAALTRCCVRCRLSKTLVLSTSSVGKSTSSQALEQGWQRRGQVQLHKLWWTIAWRHIPKSTAMELSRFMGQLSLGSMAFLFRWRLGYLKKIPKPYCTGPMTGVWQGCAV